MKCFVLWFNEDGTAQVAALDEQQSQALMDEVDVQSAKSPEAAVQIMVDMVAQEEPDEDAVDADVMRGYNSAPAQGKMTPAKVFGDE